MSASTGTFTKPAATPAGLADRFGLGIACSLLFIIVYNATNYLSIGTTQTCYAAWELSIPRIDWLIVPYWSSDFLFVLLFALVPDKQELWNFSTRFCLATVLAGACFLCWPLTLGFERSGTDHGIWTPFFQALYSFDLTYNLFPSLHVTFAVLMHPVFRRLRPHPLYKYAIDVWFGLITISTVLVHQHHLVDVLGGLILAAIVCYLIDHRALRPAHIHTTQKSRSLGLSYAAGGLLCLGTALGLGGWAWLLLWPALSCSLVALGYAGMGSAVAPTHAHGPSWASKFVLLPWLELIGWSRRLWWRHEQAIVHVRDDVHLGRIPDLHSWSGQIVDCTCEHRRRLNATTAANRHHRLPLWDLSIPASDDLRRGAELIEATRQQGPVLVVCGLGLGRSPLLVIAWLLHTGRSTDVDDAIACVTDARPETRLSPAVREALQNTYHPRTTTRELGRISSCTVPAL